MRVQLFPRSSKTIFKGERVVIKRSDNNLQRGRVGVLVSKGAFKKATDRNRIKRLSMNLFEAHLPKNTDTLIIISGNHPFSEDEGVVEELKQAIKEINTK